MFTTISMAGVGTIITVLFTVLRLFGVEVSETQVQSFIEAIGTIVGIALLVWGQFRRPDLKYGVIRK